MTPHMMLTGDEQVVHVNASTSLDQTGSESMLLRQQDDSSSAA